MNKRKKIWVFATVILIICVSMSIYFWSVRYVPGKITFQEYAPNYLPKDIKISSVVVQAEYVPSQRPDRYTMLNISMNNDGFIYEMKDTGIFSYSCHGLIMTNDDCKIMQTKYGQKYILSTSRVEGQSVAQNIYFLKENTQITINLNSKAGYPVKEVDKIVDSLRPTTYQNIKVEYLDRSVI